MINLLVKKTSLGKNFKSSEILYKAASCIIFLMIWYILSLFISDPLILPGPAETAGRILTYFYEGILIQELYTTVLRSFLGLFIGIIIGIIFGLLIGLNRVLYLIFYPGVTFLQSTPVISWLLLALIWFSSDIVPVFIVAAAVLPVITINTAEGIRHTSPQLLEMARLYNVSKKKILREIYIPQIAGFLISGIRITVGITFRVSVMAEVLSHPGNGIGERMSWARINIETADIIAWTIIIIAATIFFDWITDIILNKLFGKYNVKN